MIFESIKAWKRNMIALEVVIDEIALEIEYKYIKCEYCTLVWRLMIDYFMKIHESKDMRKYMKVNIQMQVSFENELKKWLKIIDNNMIKMNKKNELTWDIIKVLLIKKKYKIWIYIRKEKNIRLLNNFIVYIYWNILIEKYEKK